MYPDCQQVTEVKQTHLHPDSKQLDGRYSDWREGLQGF